MSGTSNDEQLMNKVHKGMDQVNLYCDGNVNHLYCIYCFDNAHKYDLTCVYKNLVNMIKCLIMHFTLKCTQTAYILSIDKVSVSGAIRQRGVYCCSILV